MRKDKEEHVKADELALENKYCPITIKTTEFNSLSFTIPPSVFLIINVLNLRQKFGYASQFGGQIILLSYASIHAICCQGYT